MGRFVFWSSHREPESVRMTGFRGQFTENGMSAHISAFGLNPAPVGDRHSAYRAMILELATALKASAEGPAGDVSEIEGASPKEGPPFELRSQKFPTVRAEAGHVIVRLELASMRDPLDVQDIQIHLSGEYAATLGFHLIENAKKLG